MSLFVISLVFVVRAIVVCTVFFLDAAYLFSIVALIKEVLLPNQMPRQVLKACIVHGGIEIRVHFFALNKEILFG